MSKEYIEREAARRTIEHYDPAYSCVLDNIPAADVVEVVRCGKCKHYSKYGHCKLHSVEADSYSYGAYVDMDNNDYCSYGERRADNA